MFTEIAAEVYKLGRFVYVVLRGRRNCICSLLTRMPRRGGKKDCEGYLGLVTSSIIRTSAISKPFTVGTLPCAHLHKCFALEPAQSVHFYAHIFSSKNLWPCHFLDSSVKFSSELVSNKGPERIDLIRR